MQKLEHQAAGHPGIYLEENVVHKITEDKEIKFYEDVFLGQHPFSSWVPEYRGRIQLGITEEIRAQAKNNPELKAQIQQIANNKALARNIDAVTGNSELSKPILMLQNLLEGFVKPSIIDIKLGKQLTDLADDTISQEKHTRLQQVADSTTSGSLYLRICGMELYNELWESVNRCDSGSFHINPKFIDNLDSLQQSNYVKINKFLGRSLTDTSFIQCIKHFFYNNPRLPLDYKQHLVDILIKRLSLMYNDLFDLHATMFSTSLLIIYENDLSSISAKKYTDETTGNPYYDEPFTRDELFGEFTSEDEDDSDDHAENLEEMEQQQQEQQQKRLLSSVNMIDFAHSAVLPEKCRTANENHHHVNGNVLDALENMLDVLKQISSL